MVRGNSGNKKPPRSGHCLCPRGDSNIVPLRGLQFLTKNRLAAVIVCAPVEIRTPVLALKGPRPGPLDDGGRAAGFYHPRWHRSSNCTGLFFPGCQIHQVHLPWVEPGGRLFDLLLLEENGRYMDSARFGVHYFHEGSGYIVRLLLSGFVPEWASPAAFFKRRSHFPLQSGCFACLRVEDCNQPGNSARIIFAPSTYITYPGRKIGNGNQFFVKPGKVRDMVQVHDACLTLGALE